MLRVNNWMLLFFGNIHFFLLDPVSLQFQKNLPAVSRIDRKSSTNVEFDCLYNGRPRPKITWYRGKAPLPVDDATFQLRDNNGR